MGNWVNVGPAIKNLKELTKQLSKKQIAIVVSRGINRTLLKGRTTARAAVKDEYNIPQKNLNGINIERSTTRTLTGSIYASTKPIPMDAFSPVFELPTKKITVSRKGVQKVKDRKRKRTNPGQGVSIEVHKGSRMVVPYAFMLEGQKPRVFARGQYRRSDFGFERRHVREENSSGNDSVKPLISTTVHAAVINPIAIGKIKADIQEHFPEELMHQIKFLVSKLPKTSGIT
jgi:hypothetical protein